MTVLNIFVFQNRELDEVIEENDAQVRRDDQLSAPTNGHQQPNPGDPCQSTKVRS